MKVVIGGGTGFIGSQLSHLLRKKGYEVIAVSRSSGDGKLSWEHVMNNGLPEGTCAVVSMSGAYVMNPLKFFNEDYKKELRDSRVQCTRILAQAAAKLQPKPEVFVSMSGVGFYPPSTAKTYTEDSKGGEGDFFARLCQEWEAAAEVPSDVRSVIVRTGLVLGRESSFMRFLYWPFYFGMGARVSSGKQFFPWVHLQDVAGIFNYAIQNKQVSGVLNAVAPEVATNSDFTRTYARALRRPAFLMLPSIYFKLLLGPERAVLVNEGQKVIPHRTLQMGYHFTFPNLADAIRDCIK